MTSRIDALVPEMAVRRPGAPALASEDGERITYAELARRIDAGAATLRGAGLRAGDRMLLVGENCTEMIVALFAAIRCDAWAVPLNARLSAAELEAIRDHSGARLALYASGSSPDAQAHAARVHARARQLPGIGRVALGAPHRAAVPEPAAPGIAQQVAVMIYTSGSTGTPKGVMLTHRNLRFLADASAASGAPLPGDDVYFALPMSHSFGLTTVMLCTLAAGACLHPVARFSAQDAARAIRNGGISVFHAVPAMYSRLLETCAQQRQPLTPNRLRMCYIGGSTIDAARKEAAQKLLGQVLHHGYGLTEAAPTVSRTLGARAPADTTVGWPFPGVEVSIRDTGGHLVADAEEGEVWVRGPNIMKGYYRAPVQTREAIDADGWLHTGDLAMRGAAGELYITGRIKELIIRGGFNVYPAEVEAAIVSYPGVAQCAVLGRALDGDEEVVAFVEPQAGTKIAPEALERHVRSRLAAYKVPRRWHVIERIPASSTGKLLKPKLKEMLAAMAMRESA
jgi:long-chain acyl-CoA synthetase